MKTGYFANTKRWTKVHIVAELHEYLGDGESTTFHVPICHANIAPDMAFQWCANYIKEDYLECENCKRKLAEMHPTMKALLSDYGDGIMQAGYDMMKHYRIGE